MANKKYHVTPDGPRPCKAEKEKCKYNEHDHSTNFQEVQELFEKRMDSTVRFIDNMEILNNPKTSSKKLTKLANHFDVRVKAGVAKHENTDPVILNELSNDSDSEVRAEVALNKNSNEETVEKLSKDKDLFVVSRAIRNPSATAEVINKAAFSDDMVLQMSAAKNNNGKISPEALEKLLNTRDQNVLHSLVNNSEVPEKVKIDCVITPMIAEQTVNRNDASSEAIERAWFVQLDDKTLPNFEKFLEHPNTPEFIRQDIENMNYLKD